MNIKEDIINRLSIFKNFYDEIRIIEPFEGRIDIIKGDESSRNCQKCFMTLGKSAPCTNCISSRAFFSDDTVIKYDYKNGKPITMIASPIKINGKKYIVEIIKRISKNELLSAGMTEANALKTITELNYKVVHDELTNIYNRRYIDERLEKTVNMAYENKDNLSIIMCDIDHFKYINDTYGHLCGDKILKYFAKILNEKSVDASGWTGRYGGEEFICLIPGKTSDETYLIAESMRDEFEKSSVSFEDKQIKATASFGIASIDLNKEITSEELIKTADEKLYTVKEHGRNAVAK